MVNPLIIQDPPHSVNPSGPRVCPQLFRFEIDGEMGDTHVVPYSSGVGGMG